MVGGVYTRERKIWGEECLIKGGGDDKCKKEGRYRVKTEGCNFGKTPLLVFLGVSIERRI